MQRYFSASFIIFFITFSIDQILRAINGKCNNIRAKTQRNDHKAKPPSGVVGVCQFANRFDGGEIRIMTVDLTEKAKENLRRNEDSNYVKLEPGEKAF